VKANGVPSGFIHWLPCLVNPAAVRSFSAAARSYFHQP
jgi:hypothetical protein